MGLAVAPANADERLRTSVGAVSAHENIAAVLELYAAVIEANEALGEEIS